jgi:hypothetical protein
MAVITVARSEPWVVARWAFRPLLERMRAELPGEADRYAVDQGLHLHLEPSDQEIRLADALRVAAGEHLVCLAQVAVDRAGVDRDPAGQVGVGLAIRR